MLRSAILLGLLCGACDDVASNGADALACAPGFLGFNGACLDDDECARAESPCGADERCINEIGTFHCEPCVGGCGVQCPSGAHDGGDGTCVPLGTCQAGYALSETGACLPVAACSDDDKEDDDDWASAQALAADGTAEGMVCPADQDVFAVDAVGPCPLVAVLQFRHGEGDLDLVLLDAQGRQLGVADSQDDDERLVAPTAVTGRLYVVVAGFEQAMAAYRLVVSTEGHDGGDGQCVPQGLCSIGHALDDAGACRRCLPNYHDGGLGTCVPVGSCSRGRHDGGDGACVALNACSPAFQLSLAGNCRPTATCPPGQVDDGTGACGATCAVGFHDGGDRSCSPLGRCALAFQDAGDGTCRPLGECVPGFTPNAAGTCLGIALCPADDRWEPNPDPARATPLAAGARVDGVVCAADQDVYAVTTDGACPVSFLLRSAAAEGDLDLDLLADPGDGSPSTLLARADSSGDDERVTIQPPESTPLFARVSGFEGAQARYTLRADVVGHDGGDGACRPLGTCAPGYLLGADGRCGTCARGLHDGGDGTCVPVGQCGVGYQDGGEGTCVGLGRCSRGFGDGGAGQCVVAGTCSAGFHDGGGACVPLDRCLPGRALEAGDCVCPEGLRPGGGGGCQPAEVCDPGFHEGGAGWCLAEDVCADGHHLTPEAQCVPTVACSGGNHDNGRSVCVVSGCADGFQLGGDGRCVAAGHCNAGARLDGAGLCTSGACAPGFRATAGGLCVLALACPADDPGEPDGAFERARPLEVGRPLYGTMCAGDLDLFRVEPTENCNQVARLRFSNAEGDLDLERVEPLMGAAEQAAVLLTSATTADLERLPLGGAGPTWVRVRGFRGASAAYVLDVVADPAGCGLADDPCGPGRRDDGTGVCAPQGTCAAGFRDGGDGTCLPPGVCVPGYHDGGDGACYAADRCAPDHHLEPGGTCPRTVGCPDDQHDDGQGRCALLGVCAAGFTNGGAGACVARGACSLGYHDTGTGVCGPEGTCSAGRVINAAGTCVAPLACPAEGAGEPGRPLADGDRRFSVSCSAQGETYILSLLAGCAANLRLDFAGLEGDLALEVLDEAGDLLERVDTANDGERIGLPAGGAARLGIRVRGDLGVRYVLSLTTRCGD